METESPVIVRQFRQILLWPLQLMPLEGRGQIHRHWEKLAGPDSPWTQVVDEIGDIEHFQDRHYSEFVTFLPAVQRFLYGEGGGGAETPIRVFRRRDVSSARVTLKDMAEPVLLEVTHIDLHFFFDLDIVLLAVELHARDLEHSVAQDLLFRLGRSYPVIWDENGRGRHCAEKIQWLAPDGRVLVSSDYENRTKYMSIVCQERAAAISSDWEYLLSPMVPHLARSSGSPRFRSLEYNRMPVMAFIAVDNPQSLSRADFVRLGLATRPGRSDQLPYSEGHLENFERNVCYDQFWQGQDNSTPSTRFLCSGHAFVVVGDANHPAFIDAERGVLGQFRHQYFLVGLIAHFHKAALLMMADRLSGAISRLNIQDPDSIRVFKRVIRQSLEIFLRFSHRYWFQEVSIQHQAKAIFDMWRSHLGTDALYDEVRTEMHDMAHYLENDGLRRQANTVVRLTVVTTFGLIGTVVTGFWGMNLFALAEAPWDQRLWIFIATVVLTLGLTFFTIAKAKRLSDFLDVLSDERQSVLTKAAAFFRVWK